ncbi:MAG: hypothetical protein IIA05_04395 [Proteobacteria bacterium]|nr:hypothetical protein [Pseudomonadota bacterium]
MSLYSYKLTHDTGFAPNPFWSFLTLATCKPKMRQKRVEGDWIAGFTSTSLCGDRPGGERLIYIMHVGEKLSIADYFEDDRFADKRSSPDSELAVRRAGDNIYKPRLPGAVLPSDFEQQRNPHHWDGSSKCRVGDARKRDVNGEFVLIGKRFVYFGREALHIPVELRPAVPNGVSPYGAPTHDQEKVQLLVDYVFEQADGIQVIAPPHDWPDDDSWSG